MQFYRIGDAPLDSRDVVFRESRVHAAIGVVMAIGFFAIPVSVLCLAGVGKEGGPGRFLFVAMALFAGLFVALSSLSLLRTFGAQNWVVRLRPGGVLIKVRSFMNVHFPADRLIVVELPANEIAWVRVNRQRRILPTNKGVSVERNTYLDIKTVSDDLEGVEMLLRDERQVKVSWRCLTNPVAVTPEHAIRVLWRVQGIFMAPNARKAVEQMAGMLRLTVQPEMREEMDLAGAPPEARVLEDRILSLVESGDIISATKVVRRHYKMSLAEARKFVAELQGKKDAGADGAPQVSG